MGSADKQLVMIAGCTDWNAPGSAPLLEAGTAVQPPCQLQRPPGYPDGPSQGLQLHPAQQAGWSFLTDTVLNHPPDRPPLPQG